MPTIHLRRVGLATLATSLVLGGTVATAGSAFAEADFDFSRISGDNRYATAAEAAQQYGAAQTVILASGEPGSYPDALTANYLAGVKDAPVLLTRKDHAPEIVKQAIKDAGADNVIIVGGTGVVSADQEESLKGTYNVRRIAGEDRFATAAAVIAEGDQAAGNTALLATGFDFPDALGGGPVAYAEGMPLAITKPDDAPDEVVRELQQAGITKVLVLGGKSAVSEAVEQELNDKGITVEHRFAGADRAETSALLANYAVTNFGFTDTAVNVASGYVEGDGADALGGAPLSGKAERPLLISKSDKTAGDSVTGYLDEHADTLGGGFIFGGPGALEESVEYTMEKAVIGSGAQNLRTGELYNDVQSAVDAAEQGDTITVFGEENPGFRVTTSDLTIKGEDGAKVSEAIIVQGADGVTVSDLALTPSDAGGQVAGVYLNDAEQITISNNKIIGDGTQTGAGVINEVGGEDEVATISGNFLHDLRQGVYANPTAEFTITGNDIRRNLAGSANDAASVIEDNKFVNNNEGVGLGAAGAQVTGNYFANNDPHVGDYTAEGSYDLEAMIQANEFDEPVVVSEDGKFVRDEN